MKGQSITMIIINIKNTSKAFKNVELFNNINISFKKGKVYGLTGPNGSGKSVLFKMICGFIKPDSGEIKIHPDFMDAKHDFPKSFGIIIDRPAYISNKTGFENLKRLASIQNNISEEHIKKTMLQVGLEWDIEQKMKNYSVGMKQKLSLGQAIMENQEVLILDEPFNGLDKNSVTSIRKLLLDLNKEGKTIILTSHSQEDIDALCDVVYEIENLNIITHSD